MNYLLLKLINMSITASYLLIAIMLIRLLFKKMPKFINCILWGIGALRLVLPFSFESKISLVPSSSPIMPSVIEGPTYSIDTGIEAFDLKVNHYLADKYFEGVTLPAKYGEQVSEILAGLWMIGIVILLAYGIISYLKLRRQVKINLPLSKRVYLCDSIPSPFILGFISPKIYIPSYMSESERELVLFHENAHLKRLDHIWKPIGYIILAIHWFNPIVWFSYILFCRDIEAACDQKALKHTDKQNYSLALLRCSASGHINICPLAFGETDVKNRIKGILDYKKPAVWITLTAVILCFITAICFLTNPVSKTFKDIAGINTESGATLVYQGVPHPIESADILEWINEELPKTKISFSPTSLSRSEARDRTFSIILGNTKININESCDSVWVDDGVKPSYSFDIKDSDKLLGQLRWLMSESVNGPTVSYFANTKDPVGAQFWLYTDTNTFRFIYSGFSSVVSCGAYEYNGERLFLYDDTGNNEVYIFKQNGESYIFDEEASSSLPKFKFSENSEPEPPISDGTVFKLCAPY